MSLPLPGCELCPPPPQSGFLCVTTQAGLELTEICLLLPFCLLSPWIKSVHHHARLNSPHYPGIFFCVTTQAVLEFSRDQAGLELTEIRLPLLGLTWGEGLTCSTRPFLKSNKRTSNKLEPLAPGLCPHSARAVQQAYSDISALTFYYLR